MMKLNNKGFAITSIIYSMLVLFLALVLLIMSNLASRKVLFDKEKNDTLSKIEDKISAPNLVYNFAYTGTSQTFTIPKTGTYLIEATGAEGTGGNIYSYTGSETPIGGKGAKLKAEFDLNAGDVITMYIGGMGSVTQATQKDGISGAGGGGTFILKTVSSITNSKYQFTKDSTNYEVLLVVAGGGGSNDSSYKGYAANGKDGIGTIWYSPANYTNFSTASVNPSSSSSSSSVLGINQIINYDGSGNTYTRSGTCTGGYGGGSCTDDSQSYGGGWSGSSYATYSFSSGKDTSGKDGIQSGNGYAQITLLAIND